MKMKLTFVVAMLVASTAVFAQSITVDFSSKAVTLANLPSTPGGTYFVQVNNINLNLYKVSIGKTDSSTSKPLSFPTFATLPIEALQKAVSGLSGLGDVSGALPKVFDGTVKFKALDLASKNPDQFAKDMTDFLDAMAKNDKTVPVVKLIDPVKVLMVASQEELIKSTQNLQAIRNSVDVLMLDFNAAFLSQQSLTTIFGTVQTPPNLLSRVNSLRIQLSDLGGKLTKEHNDYRDAIKPYQSDVDKDEKLKSLNEQILKTYTEFDAAIEKVKTPLLADNITKVWASLIPGYNNAGTTYRSLDQQFTGEEATVTINITPHDATSKLQPYSTTVTFPVNTGTRFWGVSSGFYVGFRANEAYSVKTLVSASDTTYRLVAERPGNAEIGFNTMIRAGRQWSDNLFTQIGIGTGVSVSDKVRPRMMVGGGVAIGDKHALLLDAGVIAGYYDVKSQVYAGDNAALEYTAPPTDVVVSVLRAGAYVSVSYLFRK